RRLCAHLAGEWGGHEHPAQGVLARPRAKGGDVCLRPAAGALAWGGAHRFFWGVAPFNPQRDVAGPRVFSSGISFLAGVRNARGDRPVGDLLRPLFLPKAAMKEKLAQLRAQLQAHAPLVIAYSGGVDSACLLAEAYRTLGSQVLGVIADSPS